MKTFFEYEIKYDGITVEFTDSLSITEREIHSYHEILYCDSESVMLRTENMRSEIPRKSLIIIPKGSYHSFDIARAKSFERIKISIPDELLQRIPVNVFSAGVLVFYSMSQLSVLLLRKISEILTGREAKEQGLFAYYAVMSLISELSASKSECKLSYSNNMEVTARVIDYVSKNLSGDLSIEVLARVASVSPSFLTHNFKKDVGISLHRYVTGKRMAYAKEKIDSGEKPSKFYTECGYTDYSSFYKAYYMFHGFPPSKK